MLKTENIVSGYGSLEILHGLSIESKRGQITAVIGPNGSGKSTLLRTIAGILRPFSGRIILQGEDITGLTAHNVLQKGMMFMPQGQRIFPKLTVLDNLRMGGYSLASKAEVDNGVQEIYKMFPVLREKRLQLAGELSGGQQAMVSLGMAMMSRPDIILLDEPSTGLAPKLVESVFERIIGLNEQGMTFLIVEQNIRRIMKVANHAYIIDKGCKVFAGSPEEIKSKQELMDLYFTL